MHSEGNVPDAVVCEMRNKGEDDKPVISDCNWYGRGLSLVGD